MPSLTVALRAALRAAPLVPLLLVPGRAQADPAAGRIDAALPADTLAFLGTRNLAELSADGKRCALGRIWADDGSAGLRDEVARLVDGLSDQVRAELGVDPLQFPAMVDGGLAVALLGADAGGITLALVADVGGHAADARALLEGWLDRLADLRDGVRRTEVYPDHDVASLVIHDEDGRPMLRLRGTLVAGRLYVTLRRGADGGDDLARLLALRGRPVDDAATLAGSPRFRASAAFARDGLVAWADLASLLARGSDASAALGEGLDVVVAPFVDSLVVEPSREPADRLGLVAASLRWVREDQLSRFVARLDWDPRALAAQVLAGSVRPGPSRLLASVPADVTGVDVLRLDPGRLCDDVLRALLRQGAVTPPELAEGLAHLEAELGFDPRADLLERFEGEFVLAAADVGPGEGLPGLAGRPTNFVLLATLRDGAGLAALIDARLAEMGLTVAVQHHLVHGTPVERLELFRPFVLNWSVADDLLVVSTSGELLERVLATRAGTGTGSLAADADARAALARVSPDACFFGLSRAFEAWRSVFDAVRGVVATGRPVSPGRAWIAKLPDDAVLRRHVSGWLVSALVVDAHGLAYAVDGP